MNKLKEYWILIVITLVLLGGAFYWYELRPSKIVKLCNQKAIDQADKVERENIPVYDFTYRLCTRLRGIK